MKNYFRYFIVIVLLIFAALDISAQSLVERRKVVPEQRREEMHIRFIVAKAKIEPSYMHNADSLQRIVNWIKRVQNDTLVDIVGVEFNGSVSPEGSVRFNTWLSNARLTALEKYVRSRIDIPEELIVRNDRYIAWHRLRQMVDESDYPNKEEVLKIIDSENRSTGEQLDSRIGDLKKLDNGVTWRRLFNDFFVDMRRAYVVLQTKESRIAIMQRMLVDPVQTCVSAPPITQLSQPSPLLVPEMPLANPLPDYRYMHIKSNLVGLALLQGNLAVEFDIGKYFSFNLPVYYSALDYFSPTTKFRTFAVQPEFRVWPMQNKDKLFVGAHMGFAYYNYAFNGKYRYQDKDGKTPTLGGGLSIGYRQPISRNKNWNLEFAVGAGIYPLEYDMFINEVNGPLFDTRKKTYFGLDNATIAVSYRIPIKRVNPKK